MKDPTPRATDALGPLLEAVEGGGQPYAGGFAAGITAAFAASLVGLAARVSPEWGAAAELAAQARTLRHRLLGLAAEDAEAVAEALSALRAGGERPRGPLGVVLPRAADVPLAIASAAAEVAGLAAIATESARPSVRPDAATAATLAEAACASAAHIVDVNLATLPHDERRASAAAARTAAARARAHALRHTV